MTRDEIIKLAREAGCTVLSIPGAWPFARYNDIRVTNLLERFAALVAAKEREECAKVAAWILKMPENDVSSAIRARGMK